MPNLHGLRLNCILAPLVAALLGASAVLLGCWWHLAGLRSAHDAASLAAITGYARLAESDRAPTAAAWQESHAGWTGLARLRIRDAAIERLDAAGEVPLRDEASPDLMLAYQCARLWRHGGRLVCAAPVVPRGGQASIVVGWRVADPPTAPGRWFALAAAVLGIGGLLGSYLVARVYRPVEWLQRAAESAAAGGAEPPGAPGGPETESLRSSIATLIAQRRHSDGVDDHA